MEGTHILKAVFTTLVQNQMQYCEWMNHYQVTCVRDLME